MSDSADLRLQAVRKLFRKPLQKEQKKSIVKEILSKSACLPVHRPATTLTEHWRVLRLLNSVPPYQSNKDMRALLNVGGAHYFDMHLSELAQSLRYGFLGKVDVAVVEAAEVTEDGEIIPTEGVGIVPTICRMADKILIELNRFHPKEIRGMHDIYEPADPPMRREIPIYQPSDRIGC